MKLNRSILVVAIGGALALPTLAHAHITLKLPKARTTQPNGQKGPPPCGTLGPKSAQTFKPGETIMVEFEETVPHVGRFRIAFDDDGMDFPNPMTAKDTNTTLPLFMDGLVPKTSPGRAATHRIPVTFPNKPTANGMLQVIQVMKVNPPYNTGANGDIYYQCADIVLAGEPTAPDGGTTPPDAGVDMGATGTGGAMGTGGSPGTGGAMGTGGSIAGTGGSSPSTGGTSGTGTGGTSTGTGGGAGSARGGSSGTTPPASSPEEPKSGCSVGGGTPSAVSFVALAFAALLLRRRRRR